MGSPPLLPSTTRERGGAGTPRPGAARDSKPLSESGFGKSCAGRVLRGVAGFGESCDGLLPLEHVPAASHVLGLGDRAGAPPLLQVGEFAELIW